MNPELTPHSMLTEFLLEQIAQQPVEQRILLYRALAADTKDKSLAGECRDHADDLEAIQKRERQMLLRFRIRHA